MIFQISAMPSGRLIGRFDDEGQAWAAIRRLVERRGAAYLNRLVLTRQDPVGHTRLLAAGGELMKALPSKA
ncbi:MAG TPA: hypothetical protein VK131_00240 [Candidatus Acidoferrales bacterium]|nr:hypothetical protein [Candidatus Acidoferrales bacterium]